MSTPFPIDLGTLDPIHQGDDYTEGPHTLTIPADTLLPDPNTWTDIRFSIIPPVGATGTAVTVEKTGTMIVTITGTGPWTVVLKSPITRANTLALPAMVCNVQLDCEVSGGNQVVLGEGSIEVRTPHKALP